MKIWIEAQVFWYLLVAFTCFYILGQKLDEDLINENRIYPFNIYMLNTGDEPTLRLLAFASCHRRTALRFIFFGKTPILLRARPMEKSCSSGMAPVFFEGKVNKNCANETIGVLQGPFKARFRSINVVESASQPGLTVCMAPSYWYADSERLSISIEYWLRQGASRIILYFHSPTEKVEKAAKEYESRNVTVVDFPVLPLKAHQNWQEYVYRLGRTMAKNDCILRTTTTHIAFSSYGERRQDKEKYFEDEKSYFMRI